MIYAWTYILSPLPKASLGQDAGRSSSPVALLETAARIDEDFDGDRYMLHLPDAGYTPSPPGGVWEYTACLLPLQERAGQEPTWEACS